MNVGVVIVAAGNGTRMRSSVRKPYIELKGIPILQYTLRTFIDLDEVQEIVLVVHEEEVERTRSLVNVFDSNKIRIQIGGQERHHSVMAGLSAMSEYVTHVLIHDGARPFVSKDLIKRLIAELKDKDAVIPAVPVKDTIKVVQNDRITHTPERQGLWAAQTPQAFSLVLLQEAYRKINLETMRVTDDASLLEQLGHTVYIITGEGTNIKITSPEDLIYGEAILRWMEEKA